MKQKWELLATVLGDELNYETRHLRKTANHIYVNVARNRLRCNCRTMQPMHYDPDASPDFTSGNPSGNWCSHIYTLYRPGVSRINYTELGKELFYPRYAAKAMEGA